ncbi:MAG: hypothetical protein WBJ13_02625, partial [Sedimentibacter sp.]
MNDRSKILNKIETLLGFLMSLFAISVLCGILEPNIWTYQAILLIFVFILAYISEIAKNSNNLIKNFISNIFCLL